MKKQKKFLEAVLFISLLFAWIVLPLYAVSSMNQICSQRSNPFV